MKKMNEATEIKRLWRSLGIKNLESYSKFLPSKLPKDKKEYLKDLHKILNPNRINPKLFWKLTDEYFGTDTVCQVAKDPLVENKQELNITKANEKNHRISQFAGFDNFVWSNYSVLSNQSDDGTVSLCDIGAGYGSFKQCFVDKYVNINYQGYDVISRFDDCEEVSDRGTFTKEQRKRKYDIFYTCNVFQHLPRKIIKQYLLDMVKMKRGEVSYSLIGYATSKGTFSYHYGQKVKLMTEPEFEELLTECGHKWFKKVGGNGNGLNFLGYFSKL